MCEKIFLEISTVNISYLDTFSNSILECSMTWSSLASYRQKDGILFYLLLFLQVSIVHCQDQFTKHEYNDKWWISSRLGKIWKKTKRQPLLHDEASMLFEDPKKYNFQNKIAKLREKNYFLSRVWSAQSRFLGSL